MHTALSVRPDIASRVKGFSEEPEPNTKYVILEGTEERNRFFTSWTSRDTKEDIVKVATGKVAYKILGFAESVYAAQMALYGYSTCCRHYW